MEKFDVPIIRRIYSLLNKGQARTIRAKKNVFASFLIKAFDVAISLLLVPISLNYLGKTKYGIWLTISSIIVWLNLSDVGLGNGLRNKFTEAVALGNNKMAKEYVSSAYGMLSLIVVVLIALFYFSNYYINWNKILNVSNDISTDLSLLVLIVFTAFAIRLVLNLVSILLVASHLPAVRDLVLLSGRFLILVLIVILTYTTKVSLIWFGAIYSVAPLLCLIAASLIFFSRKLKEYRPSFKEISFKPAKDLFGLGLNFFVIQISVVVLFTTDNIIIAQLFGPAEVTPYQIANKYFSIVLMLFMIILSPFWSAFTEAYTKKDMNWIKSSVNRLVKIWFLIVIITLIMLLVSKHIYRIWLGPSVDISFYISLFWAIFIILQTFNQIFTNFLNGIGKIRIQLLTAIITIFINIPLSIFFAKNFGLRSAGVILATNFSILLYSVTRGVQFRKIINNKATGIWNK